MAYEVSDSTIMIAVVHCPNSFAKNLLATIAWMLALTAISTIALRKGS